MQARHFFPLLLVLCCVSLTACFPKGDSRAPIPHLLVTAPTPAKRLVVVLPGRGDDLAAMQRTGMVQAIQSSWPDADVILTGLSLDYYLQGRAAQRLHDEIILPSRSKGYGQTWLVGASMGGMGTLLYDRAYPGEMDGLVLLAPYVGDKALLKEITQAGGVSQWQPGAVPATLDADNYQRELWRHLQGWSGDPAKTRHVWLAYGNRDPLKKTRPLLEPLLPAHHVLEREGGHDWKVWSTVTREILSAETRPAQSAP